MIYFIVPAYNEEKNIGRLIGRLAEWAWTNKTDYKLLVVDDGSQDGTAQAVLEGSTGIPCEIIHYLPNRGVAEAFRRGFKKALETAGESDQIVTLEADSTGDLGILNQLLVKIDGGADIALASCHAGGGAMRGAPWHRLLLSRSASFVVAVIFRTKGIHTFSSFYRVYRPSALRSILDRYGDFYEEKGFACVVEILVRAIRLKLRIEEVPMVLEGRQRVGESKMKIGRTILGYLRMIGRHALQ